MMKVLAFDLDDTLISGWPPDDKRTKVADQLDTLFENPHYFIVVYTARSYKIFHETRDLLRKHNIKYHALVMEKIRADYYIDDKALGIEENLVDLITNGYN